jgi:hypothetical protein
MNLLTFSKEIIDGQSERWTTTPVIIAALITSLLTIVGVVLKDFAFKALEDRRSDQKAKRAIYERYSNPLVSSAISLLIRLHEILYQRHRPVYLHGDGINANSNPGGSFRAYKKLSTMYRLAVVLGWIRACRREFSYLRVADPGDIVQVEKAIEEFEDALANGAWTEQERVARLCELWHLSNMKELRDLVSLPELGVEVDNAIWDYLEFAKVDDVSLLNSASKQNLCKKIASCLSSRLKTGSVHPDAMDDSWCDAMNIIGMREAWVYRDWQSAIGDVMLQPIDLDARKFEVLGFGDFEQILSAGSEKQKLALRRLLAIFDNLNLSLEDSFDARPRQIRSMARASAKLILAIHDIQGARSIVPVKALEIANEVICISSRKAY